MNFTRAFRRIMGSSLALRWVLSITAASGLGVILLLAVTFHEMDYQVEAQGATATVLARQKTAQSIDSEIELVEYRLAMMNQTLERSLMGVAASRSTLSAIRKGNDVAITAEIGERLTKQGFTGALVLDSHFNAIGADRTGVELLAATEALRMHFLFPLLQNYFSEVVPSSSVAYRYLGPMDASFAAFLLAPVHDKFGTLFAAPVFDDFGEPIAMVLAYRVLQWQEPSLVEFAKVTRSKIALMLEGQTISVTSPELDSIPLGQSGPEGLMPVPELASSARCQPSWRGLTICAMQPNEEIERLSAEIMSIGREQAARTQSKLWSIGALALALIMGLLMSLVRRLTRPLSEITEAIDLVANGEWRVEVKHTGREDEIGKIARAIASMQVSLAERDRMRHEMVRIDAINQRRLVLDNAVARFEDGVAVVMKNIADTVYALSESTEALDVAARQADQQAERIRNTSVLTASRTSVVSSTTQELSQSIRAIAERLRSTGTVVTLSEEHVRAAETQIGEVTHVAGEVEVALAALQGFVADMGHQSLRASLEAVAATENGAEHAAVARAVGELAAKASQATEAISEELRRLTRHAGGAHAEIGEIKGVLGHALRETQAISVAVEEQDAATREIAEGLSNSALALGGLAEAIDQLRASMASAHEASTEFVLTARKMADDAKSIDGSVRKFVREVVA